MPDYRAGVALSIALETGQNNHLMIRKEIHEFWLEIYTIFSRLKTHRHFV